MALPAYVALDVASALLTLTVALGFWAIARLSRSGLHYLVSGGFALLAVGFLFVAASHFSRVGADLVDAVRIFCQLGGALLLVFAYATYHLTGRVHAALSLGAALGGVVALGAFFYWVVPPAQSLAPLPSYIAVAYGLMSLSYLGCTILSGYGWHRRPTWGRAMVPLAFLAWTFSTYTWIFIVLSGEDRFLPVVYTWRFTAILLLIWAMVRRPRAAPGGPDAPA